MYAGSEPADREPDGSARPPLIRELLLVVGLFVVYKLGRQAANGHVDEAYANAGHVWDLERAVRLPAEGTVQDLLLRDETLIHLANTYYATVHFPATALFLGWLYWRRPRHYVWSRRVLAALTGAALVLHLLFPLAPPRLLAATGLIDTGQVYGPTVYGATPSTDSMANQFAAMPSLHFGWAVMVAVGLIVATRSRWRWLWLLHPAVTLLVIVGTANHYWLDSIVVSALLAVALAALRLPRAEPVRAHRPWPSATGMPVAAAVGGTAGPGILPGPRPRPVSSYVPSGAAEGTGAAEISGAAGTAGTFMTTEIPGPPGASGASMTAGARR